MTPSTLVQLIEAWERARAAYDTAPCPTSPDVRDRRWSTDRKLAERLAETGPVAWRGVVYRLSTAWVERIEARAADEIDRAASEAAGVTVSDDDGEVD